MGAPATFERIAAMKLMMKKTTGTRYEMTSIVGTNGSLREETIGCRETTGSGQGGMKDP
jgi:hypothetical protein